MSRPTAGREVMPAMHARQRSAGISRAERGRVVT
jgi:hypothetical protein